MKKKFLEILEAGDENAILPFLRQLNEKEKKSLILVIKKESDRLYDFVKTESNRYNRVGTQEQIDILQISTYYCFDRNNIMKIKSWRSLGVYIINNLLPEYKPEWLEDYLLQEELTDFHSGLHYPELLEWIEKYHLNFTPEFIANVFANTTYYRTNEFKIEELIDIPAFFKEHIWFLFQYPTEIHRRDTQGLYNGFKELTVTNKTDRLSMLRESLLAVNRNFNKVLTGWFTGLFLYLQPTEQELITLQDELFSTLACVQTKPVNTTLGIFKKLVTNQQFKTEEFISYLPQLLTAETKSIVNTTLDIIQQLLKKKAGNQKEILSAVTSVFINKDESMQKKAATLLIQYASPNEKLRTALGIFEENILSSVKTLLVKFLPGNNTTEKTPEINSPKAEEKRIIRDDNQISIPETYEDFIFFLNQSADLPEAYFLDHIFSQLTRWANNIPENGYIHLETVIKKMIKQIKTKDLLNIPSLYIVSCLLYDYFFYLNNKYPEQSKKLWIPWQKIRKEQKEREEEETKNKQYPYKAVLKPVAEINCSAFYNGFREIALCAKQKFETGDTRPLISTPTHTPAWIDPVVLIQKIILYQESGTEPDNMDMQLAIQRCALDDTAKALKLVEKKLSGEFKALFTFLLDTESTPTGRYDHPAWWMTAALTRSPGKVFPEFNEFIYNEVPAEQLSGMYEWEINWKETLNYKKEPVSYLELQLHTTPYELRKENPLFIEYLLAATQKEEYWMPLTKYEFCNNAQLNIPFLLYSIPNNISPIVSIVAKKLFLHSYWEVPDEKLLLHTMECFYQLYPQVFKNTDYLFLGGSMICSPEKTVSNYAAQLWSEKVNQNSMDSFQLGKAIGKIEYHDIHPIKRFTDLVYESMWNMSPRHNLALIQLIEGIITESNPQPIKNTKKLLEIYNELLALTSGKPGKEILPVLKEWQQTNLKKIVTPLIERI